MPKLTSKERIENLKSTAMAAISYVGFANYSHREVNAKLAVSKSAETGLYVDPDNVDKEGK